jgi:cell division protein FtsZ
METKLRFNLPREKSSIIKVVGVGGGGGNAVNHMHAQGIKGVDFIICNTDVQALEASPIISKIQLGASLTQGLGAGANPEVGKKAAMEAIEDIIDVLGVNTKMLFITAGMGGGTGTGAAPIIAKTAREMDILTVGIVTTPFSFEGRRRKDFAFEGLENLKRSVDCLLVISNDKIKEMYGNLPLRQAFAHANDILNTAAKGIAEIITWPGEINVDFEDVKTVMKGSGVALMGSATANGDHRAIEAVKDALSSPLLNDNRITGARNILLNVSSAPGQHELLMGEFEEISNFIQEESGFTAEMIIGTSYDESLDDKISVTLIATGFETRPKENKIIIGDLNTAAISAPKPAMPEKTRLELKDENIQPVQKEEEDPMKFELRIEQTEEITEEHVEEISFEMEEPAEPTEETSNMESEKIEEPVMSVETEMNDEEQVRKIEKQIQRIKELKNLNITINSSQGIRDLEKEPAYKRKNKKLDDVPHSSAHEVSRLSLFEDINGKPSIKTNNSFLHDNVD